MSARVTPPADPADEYTTLLGFLDFHRATFAAKCAGLTPEQLATRSCPPSVLSLLGLARHLADDEHAWFARIAGRPEGLLYADAFAAAPTQECVDEAFATWQREIATSREIAASVRPDQPTAARPDVSVRWVITHLIEEYARHNGHADLLREAIDGATGE